MRQRPPRPTRNDTPLPYTTLFRSGRGKITRDTVVALLEQAAAHGGDWLDDAHAADERAAQLGGKPVPLSWKSTGKVRTVDFLGYAYTRTPSEVSGALMTRYDEIGRAHV